MPEAEEHVGWWRRHGLAVFLLVVAASLTFLLRTVYAYSLISQCNIAYCFAGGSDSFYHARVMTWIIQNHTNLINDPLLNYPLGLHNPREPLFDWMNAILGILFAPLFGGNAVNAAMWFLEVQPAFWAALGVFPVYMVGKEVSSRRMGLIAALLYPLIVGNMESTVVTYANYLSFYAFFVFLTLAVYIHTIKISGSRRWVESYASPRSIWAGFKDFARVERNAFNWSIFTGVAFGATMLAWQGYSYIVAVVIVFIVLLVLVERLKKSDPFGPYVATLISGTLGFAMAMPYYYVQGEFGYWFTVPLLIFYGALLALLPFIMLRDTPWLFSMGVLLLSLGGAAAGLFLYSKNDFNAVITGQGYFVKNLIYSTVAEAQAPTFDQLIVSYGVVTFFLAFAGIAVFISYLYRQRFRREHLFMVILGIVGIYLPISAAKFFLIGAPLFALLPAELLLFGLDRMGYTEMRRSATSLGGSGTNWFALRRSVKARHFLIVVLALGILLPNVWYAVDAAIPYNTKSQYDEQIYNTLPPQFRTSPSQADSFYLGAAGIDTDTPQQYDEAAYNWLATQDTQLPPADRPAFISWWDYGFQALEQGDHPTVADNFQDGIDPSGHFLLSQNESLGIAVLATDLLYAEHVTSGYPYLPPQLNAELASENVNITTLHNYLVNTSVDIPIVLNNPMVYGPVTPSNLEGDGENAMYYVVPEFLASTRSEAGVVEIYQTLQSYSGWSIRYAEADSRIIPTSGSNTGIYYAPVDLTDGVVSSGGIPTWYFTVTETGSDGNTYPAGQLPPGVQAVSSNIYYNDPFYNSMIYRTFFGYNGTDIGSSPGIPGVTTALQSDQAAPGWMMEHFYMGYRTAYFCPYKNDSNCANNFVAVSLAQADADQKAGIGTVDTSTTSYISAGQSMLEYYPGQTIQGSVALSDGTPVKGVHVTILDEWGTPHEVVNTSAQGTFTLIAPPGNDTIVVSTGAVTGVQQIGTQIANTTVQISEGQAYSYPSLPIYVPITLKPASFTGRLYWNAANTSAFDSTLDTLIPGATIHIWNTFVNRTDVTDPTGTFDFSSLPPGSYNVTATIDGVTFTLTTQTLSSGQALNQDQGIKPAQILGTVRGETGLPVSGATVAITVPASEAQSTTTGTSGNYSFKVLPPGNYTVRAYTSGGLVASPAHLSLHTEGQNATANFTVGPSLVGSASVNYHGHPIPNFPIRFSPISAATNNSIVVWTNSSGIASAYLAPGIWSAYGLGALNGTWLAAMDDLQISSSSPFTSIPLNLAPSVTLEGTVYTGTTAQSGATLAVQSSSGTIIDATTNNTGNFQLLLPSDTYTVLASYATSATSPETSAIGSAYVTSTQTLDLTLQPSVKFSATVGYSGSTGFVTLPSAVGALSFNGLTVRLVSDSSGTFNLTLPQSPSTSYTFSASDYGFAETAPLAFQSQGALLALKTVTLHPIPIQVAGPVVCSSACGLPTLNFTAIAGGGNTTAATATTVNGTLEVSTSLNPGTYSVTGYSVYAGGLWSTVGNFTLTVGIGAPPVALLPVGLYNQRAYHGSLTVSNESHPTFLSQAAVSLHSPSGQLNLTGAQFTNASSPFRAPSGSYDVYVTATNNTNAYAYVGNITLNSTGGSAPTLQLQPASDLGLTFTTTLGTNLHASLNFTIVALNESAHLARIPFSMDLSGSLDALFPAGTYEVEMNQTVLLNLSGLLHYETLTTDGSCIHTVATTSCTIALQSRGASTTVTGSAFVGSSPSSLSGTVMAIPLAGQTDLKTVSAPISSGTFRLSLLPGKYLVYSVTGSGGFPDVNVTTLAVPYSSTGVSLRLTMTPGWTANVLLTTSAGVPAPPTAWVNATLNGTRVRVDLPGIAVNSTYAFVLPSGIWTLEANASSSFEGKAVSLSGNTTASLLGSNAQAAIQLSPLWQKTASLSVVGPKTLSVNDGGTVNFALIANNTGNAVEHLQFKGTPQGWKFVFSPANVTLSPALRSNLAGVEATVTVPNGTLLSQNSITFEALLYGTSTVVGTTTAAVNINAIHAFNLTTSPSTYVVGNDSIEVGFSVKAVGNSVENLAVSVQNGAILNQTGWRYVVTGSFTGLTPGNPATNGNVTLTARFPGATLPPNIQILAVDTSYPSLTKVLSITTPVGQVSLPGQPIVTGPNVGTPAPDYMTYLPTVLMVLPAVAILTFVFVRRWWKTRRWVRR